MDLTLTYEGRKLCITKGDIWKFKCEAIVNSWNNLASFENVEI